jgi:VanZ family protein
MVEVRVPLASRRVRYGIVAVVAVVVLVLSVVEAGTGTPSSGPLGLVGSDKWSHALAYAGLAATLAYASVGSHSHGRVALAVVLAVGFGIGVELVQGPIPYRTASAVDALADAVGACLAALGWWWLSRFAQFVPVAELSDPTR